jgi:hypothetical protein
MYNKIIAVGRLRESAVMHSGDVKDIITFRLYSDDASANKDDISTISPLVCRYEVFRGEDYLLALKPGTLVFVEGSIFISENQETILECTVNKMFMIVQQRATEPFTAEPTAQHFGVELPASLQDDFLDSP